jgi:hypothetical protein
MATFQVDLGWQPTITANRAATVLVDLTGQPFNLYARINGGGAEWKCHAGSTATLTVAKNDEIDVYSAGPQTVTVTLQ